MSCSCTRESYKSDCYIPLTIEKHLKNYSECDDHMERHEVLWHEWNHNKRWLTQMQQLILSSFPSYSKHDASHSEVVLHNIEMILGEENIKTLSATDCFVLLHTVYIHDIGMCITAKEREQILENTKFHEMLKRFKEGRDSDLKKYADILLEQCFKGKDSDGNDKQYILNKKLDVYYAITYLIAEYRRKEHGDVAKKRLESWIDKPDKLGVGFSTFDIPNRLFYTIANCAATHTKWDFNEVLNLPQEDTGFGLDYVHPRFIAVMLQLGDALDMDNNRFHPLTEEYLGKIPAFSMVHYRKHKAIRKLYITNEKISLSANCTSQEEVRQVRREYDGMKEILKNATYHWSIIKPKDSNMGLPTLDHIQVLLNDNEIPVELVNTQFNISQDKAFSLIKGNNIYKDENFVFLRELLQNAIDATKLQYFRDCKRILKRKKGKVENSFVNPIEIGKIVSPLDYPVEINLSMVKRKKDTQEERYDKLTLEENKDTEKQADEYEYGVLVKMTDYATGISEEDIKQIADVGSSYSYKQQEILEMPEWLQPTGTFGIGLQSVFLVATTFRAVTHTRDGKKYEITFHPRQAGEDGYINVMPPMSKTDLENDEEPYGTCFEVFVPYSKKKLHQDSAETWNGEDPFQSKYDYTKPIRHTRELIKQMALYLADLVGEALFPVFLTIQDCDKKTIEECKDERFQKKFENIKLQIYESEQQENDEVIQHEKKNLNVTWAYNLDNSDEIYENDETHDIYRLDCEKGKLYVWNQEYKAYACIGIKRILQLRENYNSKQEGFQEGLRIFYKGIQVTKKYFKKDSDLIEYIDLKDRLDSNLLKLNRNGFSDQGYEHLEEVYHAIVQTSRKALQHFGKEENGITKKIKEKVETLLKEGGIQDKTTEEIEEFILSITALVYFAMVVEKEDYCVEMKENNMQWTSLLENIIRFTSASFKSESTLFNIKVWEIGRDAVGNQNNNVSIVDIINTDRKYVIVSKRSKDNKKVWKHYLVEQLKMHEEVKKCVKKLKNCVDLQERRKISQELEEKGAFFKKFEPHEHGSNFKAEDEKEQIILKWILNNVPTMALYSFNEGNTRVNFLDVEIMDAVFLNYSMKQLTINRILENDKYERFSTVVWSGYQALSLKNVRKSIKFIKRGKLSQIGYGTMILPISIQELKKLTEMCEKRAEDEEKENELKTLYTSFIDIFEKIVSANKDENEVTKIRTRYKYMIGVTLEGTGENKEYNEEELTEQDYEWLRKRFSEEVIPNTQTEDDLNITEADKVWKEKITPKIWRFKALVDNYFSMIFNRIDTTKIYEQFLTTPSYKNLKNYVLKNAKVPLQDSQSDSLYYCLIYEMADAMLYSRWESLPKMICEDGQDDIFIQFLQKK